MTKRPRTILCWVALLLLPLLAVGAEVLKRDTASVEHRLKKDLYRLASDEFEGRGPTTKGINLAAEYIAEQFQKAGLKPVADDGSYFQFFTVAGAKLKKPATLSMSAPLGQHVTLKQGKHFHPLGISFSGTVKNAKVAFLDYGITGSKDFNYDSYDNIDVEGKVVIILRDTPRASNRYASASVDGQRRRRHASLSQKISLAKKNGAAAVIFVNDAETAKTGDDLLDFNFLATARNSTNIPVFHMKRSILEIMLKSVYAESLHSVELAIDRDLKPRSVDLTGWKVSLNVAVERGRLSVKNVVGMLEGSGPRKNETLVLGAHYDHLGYGGTSSLGGGKKMAIHNGADDNASGTTALIELARRFGSMKNRDGRRLVFIAFSAEEMGLLGAHHYCKNPLLPLKNTVAMLNLDMVGRLTPDPKTKQGKLQVHGVGTAKTFDDLVERLNKKYQFKLAKTKSGFGPSDHSAFYEKKIPVLFFFTGTHENYHRPSDTPEKVNYEGMEKIINMVEQAALHLQNAPRPEYVQIKRPPRRSGGSGPRLGFRPDYGDDKGGVLVGGVIEGQPAAAGGIKAGDRIVKIAGKEVKGLEGYMIIMRSQKLNTTIDVEVMRGKERKRLKINLK